MTVGIVFRWAFFLEKKDNRYCIIHIMVINQNIYSMNTLGLHKYIHTMVINQNI